MFVCCPHPHRGQVHWSIGRRGATLCWLRAAVSFPSALHDWLPGSHAGQALSGCVISQCIARSAARVQLGAGLSGSAIAQCIARSAAGGPTLCWLRTAVSFPSALHDWPPGSHSGQALSVCHFTMHCTIGRPGPPWCWLRAAVRIPNAVRDRPAGYCFVNTGHGRQRRQRLFRARHSNHGLGTDFGTQLRIIRF